MKCQAGSLVGCLLTAFTVVSTLSAQEVKQGTFEEAGTTAFTSPMILKTVFAATDRSLWGKGEWFAVDEYRNLGKFTCDGVSIRRNYRHRQETWDAGLEFSVRPMSSDTVQIKTRITVRNSEHNNDKAVTILLEILESDQVLRTLTFGPIKAEDNGHGRSDTVSQLFPSEMLAKRPPLTLRLTVVAKDD